MSLIDKANVVSQLNTVLSGLTVSTEDTTRLLALLETAKNGGQYTANVENELLTRIGSVTTSNTVTEVALLAKAADMVHFDRQLSTANLTTLNAFSANVGTIVFVDSEGSPYIRKVDGTWSFVDAVFSTQLNNAWAWGPNSLGQLGDNTTSNRSSPVSVVGGFTDWIQLSAGGSHSLGLRSDGTLWAWGYNKYGRLGDNTTSNRSSPVSVVGGFTDWILASGGAYRSFGLRANGTLWAWGTNDFGKLGDGTTIYRSSPVSVIGGYTDWVSVSTGRHHTFALRANGTAWAWGLNGEGQLGDDTIVNKSSPVSVVGGFTDWIQLSAGDVHSLGLRANGTLWAWGNNTGHGQLGDETTSNRSSPVSVVGGFTDWILASAGWFSSLAIRANGTMWGWGYNRYGRLGIGAAARVSSPVSVIGGYTDWVSVSTGRHHTVGLRANGTAWALGGNQFGQLGDGTTTSRSSPVSIIGGFTDWTAIVLSSVGVHTLGLRGG